MEDSPGISTMFVSETIDQNVEVEGSTTSPMWRQESATRRQDRVAHGGTRERERVARGSMIEFHVEAGLGAIWRQEIVPRGGRRECHVFLLLGITLAPPWAGPAGVMVRIISSCKFK